MKRLFLARTSCAGAGAGLLLSACSIGPQLLAVDQRADHVRAKVLAHQQTFSDAVLDRQARARAQEVGRPWLAGKAQPLSREVTLPAALRADVDTTLMFSGEQADLPTLAQRIALASGIAVRVRPDALLPAEVFLPRLASTVAPTVALPALATLPDGPRPLSSVLDVLALRLGVYWRYGDGVIEFYRTETRVFDVKALTLKAEVDVRLGRTASDRSEGGFENASSTTLTGADESFVLAAVRARIEPFLTRAGQVSAPDGAGASVVVTDTREALDAVARFVERENRALTRRVRLVFEEITVLTENEARAGIDWDLVYGSARAALSATLPGEAAVADAGRAAVSIASGPWRGSQAIVSALNRMGKVVRHSTVPVLTLNRRPVTHAVRTTFSYIDRVQTTSVGTVGADGVGAALPSVSISQKEETVGAFLTLVPDAQEDGQVLLSVSYDNTVAQPLKTVTFGQASNQVQVQQVTIDGNGTVQQVQLRPGQPMVISGFDSRQDQSDQRRTLPGASLLAGGSDQAGSERSTTVIVITAQVEEGL